MRRYCSVTYYSKQSSASDRAKVDGRLSGVPVSSGEWDVTHA